MVIGNVWQPKIFFLPGYNQTLTFTYKSKVLNWIREKIKTLWDPRAMIDGAMFVDEIYNILIAFWGVKHWYTIERCQLNCIPREVW